MIATEIKYTTLICTQDLCGRELTTKAQIMWQTGTWQQCLCIVRTVWNSVFVTSKPFPKCLLSRFMVSLWLTITL